jgi:hypothetical protein
VPVGEDPNAIFYDDKTKRVFTIDRGSKRVSAIDPKSGRVIGTIEHLGGRTEHAVSDVAGHIFLNMQDRNTLLKLDSQALKVMETWPLAPCGQPSSMDMDRTHQRVFVGCRSGVMTVVDGTSGRIITMQPIGRGVDATEFDRERGLVHFSSGDGTMSVFHQGHTRQLHTGGKRKDTVGSPDHGSRSADWQSVPFHRRVRPPARSDAGEPAASGTCNPR